MVKTMPGTVSKIEAAALLGIIPVRVSALIKSKHLKAAISFDPKRRIAKWLIDMDSVNARLRWMDEMKAKGLPRQKWRGAPTFE